MTTDRKEAKEAKKGNWRKNKLGWKLVVIFMVIVVAVFLIGSLAVQCNCNDCNEDDRGHGNTVPTVTPHVTVAPIVTPVITVAPTPTAELTIDIVGNMSWESSMDIMRVYFPSAAPRYSDQAGGYDIPSIVSIQRFISSHSGLSDLNALRASFEASGFTEIAVGTAEMADSSIILTVVAADGDHIKMYRLNGGTISELTLGDSSVKSCNLY